MKEMAGSIGRRDANKRVVRDHFERGVSRRDLDIYDTIMDEDYVLHVGLNRDLLSGGRAGYKAGLGSFQASFPDMRVELLDLIAERDVVVAHYIEQGTHSGRAYRGHAPTGRAYRKHGFGLYRLRDDRMVQGWVQEDDLAFLRALGWDAPSG